MRTMGPNRKFRVDSLRRKSCHPEPLFSASYSGSTALPCHYLMFAHAQATVESMNVIMQDALLLFTAAGRGHCQGGWANVSVCFKRHRQPRRGELRSRQMMWDDLS